MPQPDCLDGVDVPADWADAARRICRSGFGRVLILGPADVGKSTFAQFLMKAARNVDRRAALVDADVGQKTVGPPACVTLGYLDGDTPVLSSLAFVGTTNPVHGWQRLIQGVGRMIDTADADLVVVNTGGLLAGPGRRLKAAKIAAAQPDLLVVLGHDPMLESILCDNERRPSLRLAPSPQARRKTDAERRAARRAAFRRYFENASLRSVRTDRLQIEGGPAPGIAPPERLLVGLADAGGRDLALAIVAAARPETGVLDLLMPEIREQPARLIRGAIFLDANFAERQSAATV